MDYQELDENDKKKLKMFDIDLEFLKYKLKNKYKNKTIVFHKPCHLSDSDFNKIETFLKNIKEIKYKSLENPNLCCGFGGSYFMFHPFTALKIALKCAHQIKQSKADLILSACPSCTMGLRFSQIISGNFKKTLELRDFIQNELIKIE